MSRKQHKKVSIGGLTKNGRMKDLERNKTRLSSKGWTFIEYHDEGMSKSFAKFERESPEKKPVTRKQLIIVFGVLAFFGVVSLATSNEPPTASDPPDKNQKPESPKSSVSKKPKATLAPRVSASANEPVAQGNQAEHGEPSPTEGSPDIPKNSPAKAAPEAAVDLPYDAELCISGEGCEEWYLIHDNEQICILIRSKSEPVPKVAAHVLSGEDSTLSDALEEEIFDSRYAHLDDDPMLDEISKAWDVSVEKLKYVNLARTVLQQYFTHGTFIDRRGASPLTEEDLRISLDVLGGKTGRPRVLGSTNLPDDTRMMVTVSDRDSQFHAGQSSVTVRHGQFMAGPFRDRSEDLAPGVYTAVVSMSLPGSLQSAKVLLVTGRTGEQLKGPLVMKDEVGVTAKASVEFFVGSSEKVAKRAYKKRKAATKNEVQRLYREAQALEKKGRKMEPLRATDDHDKLRKCGVQMRKNQAKAKELRASADELPRSTRIGLYSAAINLNMCVSCMKDALDYCEMVRQDLKRVEQ